MIITPSQVHEARKLASLTLPALAAVPRSMKGAWTPLSEGSGECRFWTHL
jgi:hypothetical protein